MGGDKCKEGCGGRGGEGEGVEKCRDQRKLGQMILDKGQGQGLVQGWKVGGAWEGMMKGGIYWKYGE